MTDADDSRYRPFPSVSEWAHDLDPSVVDRYAARLARLRGQATEDDLRRAVEVTTRYAAVDTGAIEGLYAVDRGFTRTIATQAATWEATLQSHGEHVARSIQDALDGYEMVLDAVTHRLPVTEVWIRRLHEVMCASQQTFTVYTDLGPQQHELPLGRYKASPNSPTNASTGRVHHYAPVDDTAPEMARLVRELASDEFAALHPVVQAAYAHYAFVCVHPFADGNGRVSRALASIYLYRSPGVPLVVFADQRDVYLDALEAADRRQHSAFVAFVEQRTIDAVTLVEAHLPGDAPDAAESLDAIGSVVTGRGGYSHDAIDAAGARLLALCREALTQSQPSGRGLATAGIGDGPPVAAPTGFREVPGAATLVIGANANPPATSSVQKSYAAAIARAGVASADFLVWDVQQPTMALEVDVRHLLPAESEVLRLQVLAWAERQWRLAFAELAVRARQDLEQRGYAAPE